MHRSQWPRPRAPFAMGNGRAQPESHFSSLKKLFFRETTTFPQLSTPSTHVVAVRTNSSRNPRDDDSGSADDTQERATRSVREVEHPGPLTESSLRGGAPLLLLLLACRLLLGRLLRLVGLAIVLRLGIVVRRRLLPAAYSQRAPAMTPPPPPLPPEEAADLRRRSSLRAWRAGRACAPCPPRGMRRGRPQAAPRGRRIRAPAPAGEARSGLAANEAGRALAKLPSRRGRAAARSP